MTLPVSAPVWVLVVTRADHTCQCEGVCGRPHSDGGGRCLRGRRGRRRVFRDRLVVAPSDPAVPAHQAYRVPVEALSAWCGPCLDQARRRAAAQRPSPADIPLFEIDIPGGTP